MSKLYFDGSNVDTAGYTVKKYGSDNTELSLSEKAQKLYDETDPISIYEIINDETGEIEYWIDSALSVEKGMTADELIADMEQMYDEFHVAESDEN